MILVTGASGQLGRAIVDVLQAADVTVIAATRFPAASSDECYVDFDEPDSLNFIGVDTLVVVSAGYAEDDVVIRRHDNVVTAAERDGVEHIVYTSVATDGNHLAFALAHRWTERRIRTSALKWTILRNGIYAELFGSLLAAKRGVISAPFGAGALAAVTRGDLAEAAANVAMCPADHVGRTYDLVGARSITATQIINGTGLSYEPETLDDRRSVLDAAGLLPFQPAMLLSIYSSVANGFLARVGGDLGALLGRLPTDAEPVVRHIVSQTTDASI